MKGDRELACNVLQLISLIKAPLQYIFSCFLLLIFHCKHIELHGHFDVHTHIFQPKRLFKDFFSGPSGL